MTNRAGGDIEYELDIAAVSDAYERRVGGACPERLPLAMRLLDRLPPNRWTLEWHLPWWLGRAVGLHPEVAREIVLSNVFGLGSIRLADDLTDGEVAPDEVEAARELAAVLYELALEPYRLWFDAGSPFWGHLERRMAAWRAAGDDRYVADLTTADLAARGAPLHVGAVAVLLMAGRAELYGPLASCLDHALEALVLYDHVADWEADLEAGRWNAFVAATSSGPQNAETRDRHRTATYVAMLTSTIVASYFDRIDEQLLRAATIADKLDPAVPPLAEHLRSFAAGVREQGATIAGQYQDLGERAAKRLFPTLVDHRS